MSRRSRRRRRSSGKIGRNVVKGWYTDSLGRHRPITARKPRLSYKLKPVTPYHIIPLKPVEYAFKGFILGTPVAREVYCLYKIADSIYSHWNLIKKAYESYRRSKSLAKIAEIVGEEVIREYMPSVQTRLIWGVIKRYIPSNYQRGARKMVATLVDDLTEEEIKFVKRSL